MPRPWDTVCLLSGVPGQTSAHLCYHPQHFFSLALTQLVTVGDLSVLLKFHHMPQKAGAISGLYRLCIDSTLRAVTFIANISLRSVGDGAFQKTGSHSDPPKRFPRGWVCLAVAPGWNRVKGMVVIPHLHTLYI